MLTVDACKYVIHVVGEVLWNPRRVTCLRERERESKDLRNICQLT